MQSANSLSNGQRKAEPEVHLADPQEDACEAPADTLRIGGFVPLSLVDFPGKLACVVFLRGCPWRCSYCYNASLRELDGPVVMTWEQVRVFLKKRRGLLEGVVFSGGEPTVQRGLLAALREVRAMGYATALHTAGILPKRLQVLLPLLDWVGLDAKAPPDARYDRVTGRSGSARRFLASLQLLVANGTNREIRTTVDAKLLGAQDIAEMQWRLLGIGAGPSRITEALFEHVGLLGFKS